MIDRDAPRALKIQFWAVVAALIAGGCLLAWLALSELLPVLSRSAAGAATLAFSPGSMFGLPLALALFCFAAMALLPKPVASKARRSTPATARTNPLAGVLLAVAVACIPLGFLAPALSRSWVSGVVEARDYQPCERTGGRHSSLRWVRAGGVCPA